LPWSRVRNLHLHGMFPAVVDKLDQRLGLLAAIDDHLDRAG
jgi:hypothetical protein